jgi:hypothetical protein
MGGQSSMAQCPRSPLEKDRKMNSKPLPYSPLAFLLWMMSAPNADLSDKSKFVDNHFTRDTIEQNGSTRLLPLQEDMNQMVKFFSTEKNFAALQSARELYLRMLRAATLWSTDCKLMPENVWTIANLDRIALAVEAREAADAETSK